MVEIPTLNFNPGVASARNIRSFNPVGFEAQANLFRGIENKLNQQVAILNDKEDQRVAQESLDAGLQAGMEDDFDPNGLPKPGTIAADNFRKGAIQTFTIQTQTDIESGLAQIELQNARNPEGYRAAAEDFINQQTGNLPPQVQAGLQATSLRRANAAYINMTKAELARQRKFQEKTQLDRIDLLTGQIAQSIPGTEAEIEKDTALKTDLARELDLAVEQGTITAPRAQMIMQDAFEKQRVGALTGFVLETPSPQETMIKALSGRSGIAELDNASPQEKLQLMRIANERQNAELAQENRRKAQLDEIRRERFAELSDVATFSEDPIEREQALEQMRIFGQNDLELQDRVRRLRDRNNQVEVDQSDQKVLQDMQLAVALNDTTNTEIQDLVASGDLLPADARKLRSDLERNRRSLLSGAIMDDFKSRLDVLFPSQITVIGGRVAPSPENQAAKNALIAKIRGMVEEGGGVDTDAELSRIINAEITAFTQLSAQSRANVPAPVQSALESRVERFFKSKRLTNAFQGSRAMVEQAAKQGEDKNKAAASQIARLMRRPNIDLNEIDKATIFFMLTRGIE